MNQNSGKLKILFLSQRFLFPQDTGGKIRTGKILEQLSKIFSITVISNVESPQDDPYVHRMSELCDKFIPVSWVEKKRYTLSFYWDVFKKSMSVYPVTMLNDYSPELENAVLEELAIEHYDLAICDFMQSTLLFRNVKGLPILLFQHNVEATISKRHMERSKDPVSKIFWWLQYRKMRFHERKQCNRFDGVIAVSENDKQRMTEWYGTKNIYTIPTGVDTDYYSPDLTDNEKNQIVFVGAMDWLPNHDAMIYFLENIFPKILSKKPEVQFTIVGRNPSPKLAKMVNEMENVLLTGWVNDTRPYLAESAVFIIPIRIGGGTRMKIYEGMAMGKAIVSTSIGAEGLPVNHGEHIYLADDENEFAKFVLDLLQNEAKRNQIGARARQYVYEYYRWEKVAEVFGSVCQNMVNKAELAKAPLTA